MGDAPSLGALRWMWSVEAAPELKDQAAFVHAFGEWMAAVVDSHVAFVAIDDDVVVGMALLALMSRPPDPGDLRRVHGELQSVYVMPSRRNAGVGSKLISAAVDHGRVLGLGVITVRAGRRSLPLYARHGFAGYDRLLQLEVCTEGHSRVGHPKP